MAKLIVYVSLAVSLTIALTVSVKAGGCFSCAISFEDFEAEVLANLNTVGMKKVEKLARDYIEALDDSTKTQLSHKDVKTLMEKLDYLKSRRPDLDWVDLDMNPSRQSLFSLWNSVSSCQSDTIDQFLPYAFEQHSYEGKFALELLRDYLKKCGPEEQFKRMIETIEQNSPEHEEFATHLYLKDYLAAEFWPEVEKNPHDYEPEEVGYDGVKRFLNHLLSSIEKFSALDSTETGCSTELMIDFVDLLANIKGCPELRKIINYSFEHYLYKCGQEEPIRGMIATIGKIYAQSQLSATDPESLFPVRKI